MLKIEYCFIMTYLNKTSNYCIIIYIYIIYSNEDA